MEKDFLVFYFDGNDNHVAIIRVAYPPHDAPRGTVLQELLEDGLVEANDLDSRPIINGAVELAQAAWASGRYCEVVMDGGRVCSIECSGGKWRVHA